ncbi:MAG: hypothetical protein HOV83_06810 [Catenulispora sp.]|nr:hypothetical protein [Catenulispora sp.]
MIDAILREGYVPVALPTTTHRYFADPYGLTLTDLGRRELLLEWVELGGDRQSIDVELPVRVRKRGVIDSGTTSGVNGGGERTGPSLPRGGLAAGVEMKVVQETSGHTSSAFTSVFPQVATSTASPP